MHSPDPLEPANTIKALLLSSLLGHLSLCFYKHKNLLVSPPHRNGGPLGAGAFIGGVHGCVPSAQNSVVVAEVLACIGVKDGLHYL